MYHIMKNYIFDYSTEIRMYTYMTYIYIFLETTYLRLVIAVKLELKNKQCFCLFASFKTCIEFSTFYASKIYKLQNFLPLKLLDGEIIQQVRGYVVSCFNKYH